MSRRPKDIGTAAETAVVRYLAANGFPHAERRALRGEKDAGDITGTPGICWEVKGGDAAKDASDKQITDWLNDTFIETCNAHEAEGVLVLQRRGVGPANAGRWWAVLPAWGLTGLTARCSAVPGFPTGFPVRMLLSDVVRLLRANGYGDPEVS